MNADSGMVFLQVRIRKTGTAWICLGLAYIVFVIDVRIGSIYQVCVSSDFGLVLDYTGYFAIFLGLSFGSISICNRNDSYS